MPLKQISVQAMADYMDSFENISGKLKDAGMIIQDELRLLGHFRGQADEQIIERLKAIPGVAAVDILSKQEEQGEDYSISDLK